MSNADPNDIDVLGPALPDFTTAAYYQGLSQDARQYGEEAEYRQQFYNFIEQLHQQLYDAVLSGDEIISRGNLYQAYPDNSELQSQVDNFFNALFPSNGAAIVSDLLASDLFAQAVTEYNRAPSNFDFAAGWDSLSSPSALQESANEQRQQVAGVYGDALFDQLQLEDGLRNVFDEWFDGYIKQGQSQMPQVLFEAVYDDVGPTMLEAVGVLGPVQDFDITNMPASGTETGGTSVFPENANEGDIFNKDGRRYIYRNGQWVIDESSSGGIFRSGDIVRMGDGTIYIYDQGPDGPIYTPVNELPAGEQVDWDFSQQSDDDGGLLDTAIDFIQGLLGGGGGSMSQDQAQVLQNVLRDLIDFEVGDITAETGDQQTEVDVQTDVDASSDVDVVTGDVSAEGGMADVDIGPQTQTTTIEEGAIQNAPVFTDAVSVSDLISEGAFDVGGGQATVGNVTTGPSTATVGNIDVGDSTATIEEGAIQNMPVFTDAVSVSDIISEGAFSDLIGEGALSAQGGAGGAGGAGGTGGAATSTAQGGSVSNVFDVGNMFEDIGNFFGGAFESAFDFVGDIFDGQSATALATILADEAARNYAADKYGDAAAAELDFQKDIYGNTLNLFRPFYEAGTEGAVFDDDGQLVETGTLLPEFVDMAKTGVDYTGLGLDPFDEEDPGLRFLQDEARRAIENSAAARGRLNTGGTLTDLQDRAAGIASTRAADIANINAMLGEEARRRDQYDFGKLGQLTGGAFDAASAMSGANQNFASAYGDILGQQGAFDFLNARERSGNYKNLFQDLFPNLFPGT